MTDKPTPKELENLFVEETGFDIDDFPAAILDFALAVLAKWGQPAQATNGRKVFVCTHCDGVYADQPVTQCDCLPDENTFTEGWICFGAPAQAAEPVAWMSPWRKDQVTTDYDAYGKHGIPLVVAQQSVARVQLTPERVKEIVRGAGYDQCGIPDTERSAFINGLRHGEQAHGIGETP